MPDTLSRVASPLLIWSDATADTGIGTGTAAEALALITDGIVPADGLRFRSEGTDRTCRIAFHRDFRREAAGVDWRLFTYGPGHWCVGTGHSGTFPTAEQAIAAGVEWIETGRDASARRAA